MVLNRNRFGKIANALQDKAPIRNTAVLYRSERDRKRNRVLFIAFPSFQRSPLRAIQTYNINKTLSHLHLYVVFSAQNSMAV